jgi:SAM-dependent methyltransferase
MKTLQFKKEPEYADLWDACLHFLYNKNHYVKEVSDLFSSIGINRKSRILDSCAGTGFISLYLRQKGFNVECMDLMSDEIRVFKRNAEKLGVSGEIKQLSWKQIPESIEQGAYDFLFCRGNSFIYANGGWNKKQAINNQESLRAYEETLRSFYNTLRVGGYLYIDKFPDSQISHNELVAKIKIGNIEEDLIFYTRRYPDKRCREAMLVRRGQDGKESGIPNVTYDLREGELENLLVKVGFRNVRRLHLNSEKKFNIWLAQK